MSRLKWIDVPRLVVFEGLYNLKNLMSKGLQMISYGLTSSLSHIEFHPSAKKSLGFAGETNSMSIASRHLGSATPLTLLRRQFLEWLPVGAAHI
jgi:hypothetical protein